MEWRDEGIVLGTRRHGETSVILEVMTRARGRHLGMVKGGRSRRFSPLLQPGNRLALTWRARIDEHLGLFTSVEAVKLNAARLFASAPGVYGIQTLGAHLRLLPERDPHGSLFDALAFVVDRLDAREAGELLVRFELMLLEELGFGLDLSECAATGTTQELVYVSPRSGRAVSREAGLPWVEKMLPLPAFLIEETDVRPSLEDIRNAFRMTGFFFARHVYEPRGLEPPQERDGFLSALLKRPY
ncbi:DNA repair protein RecO [Limoniibacter endophyticus]|uniref:DNA repair protein RecO n=1 Tax=Limoniibacter endophyticus TaxID=1565040 RepID=A0A8J3GH14_9HYPH|nr:DNA repair protein RecO [Limoniibacter endophyticus]GHC68991.1 DNA repair protein RecO [Limoniibacter endophyticus]